jgi:hypothetical protein
VVDIVVVAAVVAVVVGAVAVVGAVVVAVVVVFEPEFVVLHVVLAPSVLEHVFFPLQLQQDGVLSAVEEDGIPCAEL